MRPLAVVGNVNVDLILGPAAPWPQPGTEIVVDHDELRIGGQAGNTSLAWAGLGVPHAIAANVGDDAFGAFLKSGFADRSDPWPVEATRTTVSVGITHPDGERTFFTTHGHLPVFGWTEARRMLTAAGLDGGLLLVCGSFLTASLTADYAALFAFAAERGIDIALDTGWPLEGWTEDTRHRALAWLAATRHLLLNEVETAALSGLGDPEAGARALAARLAPGGVAVVKRGALGVSAAMRDGPVLTIPAPAVTVVDTIGAGDTFNAGYLAAIAEGRSLPEALAAGVGVASAAVSTRPRRYGPA